MGGVVLGCAFMADASERVAISNGVLESGAGVFQLSQVAGVRVGVVRGSYAGRWVGCMSVLIALGYGGCFVLVSAATGDSTGYWIVGSLLFGGLGLFAWSAWLAPPRFVVLLSLSGKEIGVATYEQQANAQRVVSAVTDALRTPG